MGWDGMGWDGMGWDGTGRDGTGRNRIEQDGDTSPHLAATCSKASPNFSLVSSRKVELLNCFANFGMIYTNIKTESSRYLFLVLGPPSIMDTIRVDVTKGS